MEKCWNEAFTVASIMVSSGTFAVNSSDVGFYLGVLSKLASSLPFASTIFSAATQVADSLKEAQQTAEFKNISMLTPSGSPIDASLFSSALATHFTVFYHRNIPNGEFSRDSDWLAQVTDTFFRAARRLDEKTARRLFGDDGDKDAVRLLALEHSRTALAFVVKLPEIQI